MEMGGSIWPLSPIPLLARSRHGEMLLLLGHWLRLRKLGSYLGRLGKPFIHFFLVSEQLLDARALQHALEMRRDVGEARDVHP